MQVSAFVGIGSNMGERLAALRRAVSLMEATEGVSIEQVSDVYETEAHVLPGQAPQPDHLNAVVQIRTQLPPNELLSELQRIERAADRISDTPSWSPRPLDLDLLLFGDQVKSSPGGHPQSLVIPHPRMAERRFVLQPLADLVHNLVVPGADGLTVSDLLEQCPDARRVERTVLRLADDPTLS